MSVIGSRHQENLALIVRDLSVAEVTLVVNALPLGTCYFGKKSLCNRYERNIVRVLFVEGDRRLYSFHESCYRLLTAPVFN